jgi:hypothetical protein
MSHSTFSIGLVHRASTQVSRRAVIQRWSITGLALIGAMHGWPRPPTAPVVSVMPPTIVRDDCAVTMTVRAIIRVHVAITHLSPGHSYEILGEIMESDRPDGEADFCDSLTPQTIPATHGGTHAATLEGRILAANLGLIKGIGPARDEAVSPDLTELFAQVWLRDLTTGAESEPWTSPLRAAVARDLQSWTPPALRRGNELAMPRTRQPSAPNRGLPPPACAS